VKKSKKNKNERRNKSRKEVEMAGGIEQKKRSE